MKKAMKHILIGALIFSILITSTLTLFASTWAVPRDDPYAPPNSGTFNNQKAKIKDYEGKYSVYIPVNFEPCSPGVMLLAPNGVSAEKFLQGDIGTSWKQLARSRGFAVVVVEADSAKSWNLDLSEDARDDEAFIKKVYDTIRSKNEKLSAAFDLNERAFYLVGYKEGGVAAHKVTMAWPTIFCGVTSVGASVVPSAVIEKLGNAYSYPFAQADSLAGREENKLANKNIPVPMWIIEGSSDKLNSSAVEAYWVNANKATLANANDYAQKVYTSGSDAAKVWITDAGNAENISEKVIWDTFLSRTQRFVGDPGGRLVATVQHTNNGETGFFFTEQKVDGYIRRWYTYVPSSYNASANVPLVVAMHGYTSSISAFTGDSRWQDVAEKNGFIVVFPQAYPIAGGYDGTSIPAPYWSNYSGPAYKGVPDDVSFLKKLISTTKTNYAIDSTKVFATGHSNGSGMSWRLALDAPELFTAVAPVGLTMGSYKADAKQLENPLPIWVFKGEYDIDGSAVFDYSDPNNTNVKALEQWTFINGLDVKNYTDSVDASGRYLTTTYTNGKSSAPLFKFTTVKNAPHAYHPEQAEMIWSEFFSKITLGSDGVRFYNGALIK